MPLGAFKKKMYQTHLAALTHITDNLFSNSQQLQSVQNN